VDAELEELAMDSRGSPERGFAAAKRVTRALISVLMGGRPPVDRSESFAQCSRKRRRCQRRTVSGGHNHEGVPPQGPDPGQPDPKEAIGRSELGPDGGSLVHRELLAQGQVLEGELAVGSAACRRWHWDSPASWDVATFQPQAPAARRLASLAFTR
jgi:hypothetical protein